MGGFFNMDNKFFMFMGKIADLAILNFLCILCCIPIITAGASITAMYYVTLKMVRNEESYIVRSFFKSFRQNLKQGILIHLLVLAISCIIGFDLYYIRQIEIPFSSTISVIFIALTIFLCFILLYLYPILAKFYNNIKNTFRNALLMSIRHFPYTFVLFGITLSPILILFIPTASVQSFCILVFTLLGFSSLAYIKSLFFVKIFDKYVSDEIDENKETVTIENTNVE